jgi:hypothetical protein
MTTNEKLRLIAQAITYGTGNTTSDDLKTIKAIADGVL